MRREGRWLAVEVEVERVMDGGMGVNGSVCIDHYDTTLTGKRARFLAADNCQPTTPYARTRNARAPAPPLSQAVEWLALGCSLALERGGMSGRT